MMTLAIVLTAALLGGVGQSRSTCSQPASVQIHWSDRKNIESPNCNWLLEVRPKHDQPADVYLKQKPGKVQRLLFKLNRDGMVHWGQNSRSLLLEDQAFSNSYRLKLFNLDAVESESQALEIDKRIRLQVERKIGPTEKITYYFPRLVAWAGDNAIISVGVVTVHGEFGPFTPHCFAYVVATQPIEIKSTLSEAEIEKGYKGSCQVWP